MNSMEQWIFYASMGVYLSPLNLKRVHFLYKSKTCLRRGPLRYILNDGILAMDVVRALHMEVFASV